MIDEVESKHLQLLISRAFHAIIGKKCLHYNWYNSKERSTAGGDYLVTITVSTNFENVLSQIYTTVVTSNRFRLYVRYKL